MGLFAYLNYDTPTDNKAIAQTLINALKVLALRGYDSVGVGLTDPSSEGSKILVYKNAGSVDKLAAQLNAAHIPEKELRNNVAMAHTRWATHGVVSDTNAQPFPSDAQNGFIVCLNGMIRNYSELKESLVKKGLTFETDTDTEVVAKLIKLTWEQNKLIPFGGLIRNVVKSLEGAFALSVMSTHYPNEFVTTCYGSPLFLGVNMYDKSPPPEHKKKGAIGRTESKSSLFELARTPSSVQINRAEYFISSNDAALSSYTPTCIQLQDGDLLHFRNGRYQYYNTKEDKVVQRDNRPAQKVGDGIQSVDKGHYAHFMLKEIHDQAQTIVDVLRGRVDYENNTVKLGGIEQHVEEMRTQDEWSSLPALHLLTLLLLLEELWRSSLDSPLQSSSPPISWIDYPLSSETTSASLSHSLERPQKSSRHSTTARRLTLSALVSQTLLEALYLREPIAESTLTAELRLELLLPRLTPVRSSP